MLSSHDAAKLFKLLATNVALVTVAVDGDPYGCTANGWAEAGDPPLMLITLKEDGRTYEAVEAAGAFCVNVLAADQADLAWRFSRPVATPAERFADIAYDMSPTGMPVIAGCLASFECRDAVIHPFGSYKIVVGTVGSTQTDPDTVGPLVHYDGRLYPLGERRPVG